MGAVIRVIERALWVFGLLFLTSMAVAASAALEARNDQMMILERMAQEQMDLFNKLQSSEAVSEVEVARLGLEMDKIYENRLRRFHDAGTAKARSDLAVEKILLHESGLFIEPRKSRPRYGGIYVSERLGVEVISHGCVSTKESEAWRLAYNSVVAYRLKQRFGESVMAELREEMHPAPKEANPYALNSILPPATQAGLIFLVGMFALNRVRSQQSAAKLGAA